MLVLLNSSSFSHSLHRLGLGTFGNSLFTNGLHLRKRKYWNGIHRKTNRAHPRLCVVDVNFLGEGLIMKQFARQAYFNFQPEFWFQFSIFVTFLPHAWSLLAKSPYPGNLLDGSTPGRRKINLNEISFLLFTNSWSSANSLVGTRVSKSPFTS